MVTNKVLECDVKTISFEIITFNELKEIINSVQLILVLIFI